MLARVRRQALALNLDVDLRQMDGQHLTFPDERFDAVVATFVFCSLPVAVQGLRAIGRVTRTGGDIWLLEYVWIDKPVIGPLMDLMNEKTTTEATRKA